MKTIENWIISLYKKCPLWLQDIGLNVAYCMHLEPHHGYVKEVLDYWEDKDPEDPELAKALNYLQATKNWNFLPGEYEKKYRRLNVDVRKDTDGFPFVIADGKKLYFPKTFGVSWAVGYYRFLIREQDPESPHCYFADEFPPPLPGSNAVLLDIGAAEAFLSLQYIDRIKHAFIFECNDEWIEALHKTFEPYQDKVTIVQKFVSNSNDNNCIRLDDFIRNSHEINGFNERFLVKMDVEGAESKALKGCMELIRNKHSRFAVCTYHKPNDAKEFDSLFTRMGYNTKFSKNYALYGGGEFGTPSFRKGIIRAWCDSPE